MIKITFYSSTGHEQSSLNCETIGGAFELLQRMDMDAIAFPIDARTGMYMWRKYADNTFQAFNARMRELGATDPIEQSAYQQFKSDKEEYGQ